MSKLTRADPKEFGCDNIRDEVLVCWFPTDCVLLRGGTAGLLLADDDPPAAPLPKACKELRWTRTGATGSILILLCLALHSSRLNWPIYLVGTTNSFTSPNFSLGIEQQINSIGALN